MKKYDQLIDRIEKIVNVAGIKGVELYGHCPIHEDSKPSFYFNLESQAFHCFAGCLKGRGVDKLVAQVTGKENLAFQDVPIVINKAESCKKATPHIPCLPLALDNDGEDYLVGRGFSRDTIEKWSLQYWHEEKAIVIPIEKCGYALRYLDKTAEKKYKYVSGTQISKTLFGLSHIPETPSFIILVEGSFDCIYLHQIGYSNSLALLHADISLEQMKMLGGVTDRVYIMLDGDDPGRQASQKIRQTLKSRFLTRECVLPNGKDPDDMSREQIEKILKEAK